MEMFGEVWRHGYKTGIRWLDPRQSPFSILIPTLSCTSCPITSSVRPRGVATQKYKADCKNRRGDIRRYDFDSDDARLNLVRIIV